MDIGMAIAFALLCALTAGLVATCDRLAGKKS